MKTISFNKALALLALTGALSFVGCNRAEEAASESMSKSTVVDMAAAPADAASPSQPIQPERKLTKEAFLKWGTSDIDKTHQHITALVKKNQGYISDDHQTRDEYQISSNMEIRIPAVQFDSFISAIESEEGRLDEKNIKVLDVTEEFIDVTARLKTKKELEQHYLELLKQTRNIEEVMQVEQQLSQVRGEIESVEGRLRYLNSRIDLSVLTVEFYETTSAPVGFFGELGKSFVEGWKNFLYFILGALSIWPILLLLGGVIFWWRRRKAKKVLPSGK